MTEAVHGIHEVPQFQLDGGAVLPQARLAYLTMGHLDAARTNAILVTHGYTTGHRFIEPGSLSAEGSWSELVGPGRPIDTNRFFVISSNALGSCHGSSGPASVDPATGRLYGPTFPVVTLADTVRLQRSLLASLGVERLHAVAGPSMGGFQALQWGVQYPQLIDRLVVAVSGLRGPVSVAGARALAARIESDPAWNGGWPEPGAMIPFLTSLRLETLGQYGMTEYLEDLGLTATQRAHELQALARGWAEDFHPWSLVSLRGAIDLFDVENRLADIRARVLFTRGTTDAIFPAADGPQVVEAMRCNGVDVTWVPIESRYGHLASGIDWAAWQAPLRQFLD